MKFREFKKIYPEACDEIYNIIGDKKEYSKKDALKMAKKAIPIFAKRFQISKKSINERQQEIDERISDYVEPFFKVNGFDGILMGICFGLLEGSGKEKIGFGKWTMVKSLFCGGITLSNKED